jgi:hypothetical protein
MKKVLGVFGLRFTTGHAIWAVALIPACIALLLPLDLLWVGITVAVVIALAAVVTIRGRRLTGWVAAVFSWRQRHRNVPDLPSEPAVGATVLPGDHVAVRWQDDYLVSAIELVARPFTPTVIVNGQAYTDDVVDTRLVEQLPTAHCPDLEGRRRLAGYRWERPRPRAGGAHEQVVGLYPRLPTGVPGSCCGPNPAYTRIAAAARVRRRGSGPLPGGVDHSYRRSAGQQRIDARPIRSFDDFDRATEISFERETWSAIKGRSTSPPRTARRGGPMMWAARADHTTTRVRIRPGFAPTKTVLLTKLANPTTPRGFSCLFGGQRAALQGVSPVTDRHYELPIGSAGVLVGETADRHPVYMPFDDVDVSINLGDARLFTQFVVRSAAAGAVVALGAQFGEFAGFINGRIGQFAKVSWPNATTYLGPHPGIGRVVLRHNFIDTPRHQQLPIRLINPREESRFQMALEQ